MDQNSELKRRKPPPVPKFQDTSKLKQSSASQSTINNNTNDKKSQLQSKLNDFLTSISQSKNQQKNIQANNNNNNNNKIQDKFNVQNQSVKTLDPKKASLASLNSKLNSMLNSKKISLNKLQAQQTSSIITNNNNSSTSKSFSQIQIKKKQTQVQYDPFNPNVYEASKNNYLQLFQALAEEKQIEQETKTQQKQPIENQEQNQNFQQFQEEQQQGLQEKQQLALRMMQKFGYKVGDGLGKLNQGIKTPLTVKKTNDSSCIIQQSSISLQQMIPIQTSAKNVLQAFNIEPTSVIVLNGIIKFQQLTQDVEKQIRQQCQRYGNIEKWVLYVTSQNKQFRVFVKYSKVNEAFQAFVRMNNLYFYEAIVSVRFYNQSKFFNMELQESLHQHLNF